MRDGISKANRGLARIGAMRAALLGSAALLLAAAGPITGTARAQGAQPLTLNIRPQELGSALTAFADRAGLRLLFPSNIVAGKTSPALSGSFTREQALSRLLAGTGLVYQFTSANTVTIADPSGGAVAPAEDGSVLLDTVTVTSQGGSAMNADTPYETPDAVSHISREQLDQVPPNAAGDVFVSVPGVINSGTTVGNSLNPNIRGLQGSGRVNTTVDGAHQTSSSFRGYIGNRDETFVDPDMIGGIDISRGPSDGVGAGAIGGNINFRTLSAEDIVRDGETWGVRLKGGLGNNTVAPPAAQTRTSADRPSFFEGDTWSGNVAIATNQENFEGIAAFSKRKQGNYFAGTDVPSGVVFPTGNYLEDLLRGTNVNVLAGNEVFNTSEDTESVLVKGKLKWGDGQSFELGYMLYDSIHGELYEPGLGYITPYQQWAPSHTRVDSYTAKYRHAPSDNPLLNLRANLYYTDLYVDRRGTYPPGQKNHGMETTGGDISNTSVVETAHGTLTLDGGLEFRHEHATATLWEDTVRWNSFGPAGFRTLTSGFGKASFSPTDWLEFSAGGRIDHFEAEGEDFMAAHPDKSGTGVSPNFGVTVTPFDGIQLFAQYKQGYRPPSLRELYWEYLDNLVVNPDLDPELSKTYEFGINVLRNDVLAAGDKLRFKAVYFDSRYDDYIIVAPVSPERSSNHFTNIDHANYEGIEISGSYDAGWFFADAAFTRYFTVEYCTPEDGCRIPKGGLLSPGGPAIDHDYFTNYIPPEYSGSLTAGVRLLDQALTLGGRVRFASRRIGADWPPAGAGWIGMQHSWPSSVVYDMFGSYKFSEDTSLSFSIENITDEYYFAPMSTVGIPAPGRTARLDFTHRFGGGGIPLVPAFSPGRASIGAPGDDWTGLYAGAHLGYSYADLSGHTRTAAGGAVPSTESADLSEGGGQVGVQLGYNFQLDNRVVLGVEGDFSLLNQASRSDTLVSEAPDLAAAGHLEAVSEYELEWMASLRGRIGYSFGRLMIYGTGGLALLQQSGTRTQYRSDTRTADLPAGTMTERFFTETDSVTQLGWTAEAGLEYALADNWSLKAEYGYAAFGAKSLLFPNARQGVTCGLPGGYDCCDENGEWYEIPPVQGSSTVVNGRDAENEASIHTLKIGLNYRF